MSIDMKYAGVRERRGTKGAGATTSKLSEQLIPHPEIKERSQVPAGGRDSEQSERLIQDQSKSKESWEVRSGPVRGYEEPR
jgi:hypothetical protein